MLDAYHRTKSLESLKARLPEAAAQVRQELGALLADDPQNPDALLLLASCHLLEDESNEARQAIQSLLAHSPDHAAAKTELAKILFTEGDSRGAIRLLAEVTSTSPEVAETWSLLGDYLQQDGQTEASQDTLKQYDMIKAFNDRLADARQAISKANLQEADAICRHLLKLIPNEVRTLRLLASIARRFQHYEFSTATLARCVETRPTDIALGLEYGSSLLSSRMYQEALLQCDKLIELAPETIDAYELKAEVLYNLGRYEEAIEIYRVLAEVPDRRAPHLLHLGKVLKVVGEAAEAKACYQQAIEIEPAMGQAYWGLADLKTYRFTDEETTSMRALLEGEEISAMDRVLIQFSLGKALEDAQQFEESFQQYDAANKGYSNIQPYRYNSQDERFRSFFTAEYFSGRNEQGNETDAPVFVVGLPRSGTTLVEQILSSHSLVDPTQELDEIVSIARAVNDPNQAEAGQYPQSLANLSADQVQELAQRYLDYAQPFRQEAPYFVDKAPHNFHHIGLIKTLFPNAKIIDMRRDPMASGWSLYRQFFSDSFPFSYNLETIGKYYNDYVALMDHWNAVLPGQILTINYEDLVTNFPDTVDSLLAFCGLEFEEACRDFHLNKRAVATPSSEQVRQPLYSAALEHWKNYEAWLGALGQAVANEEAPQDS